MLLGLEGMVIERNEEVEGGRYLYRSILMVAARFQG